MILLSPEDLRENGDLGNPDFFLSDFEQQDW
jgi:hypothetical protein